MKPMMLSGIIALALTGWGGYRMIQVPTQKELAKLDQQLEKERATQGLREKLAGSYQELEGLRKKLAPEPSTEWLLREVTKHAEEEHIQLQSISPQDHRKLRDAIQLSVTLQLNASYLQLGKFLNRLESVTPYIWVEDLRITRGEDGQPEIRATVSTLYAPGVTAESDAPRKPARRKPS